MRIEIGIGVLLVAAAGCDARAGDDYQGESLMQLRGSLLVADGELPRDAVPALAFEGPDGFHLLDVETQGQFPANFSIDVMSPPPAAAMNAAGGRTPFALAYITAAPSDHPAVFELPAKVDGAGGFSWCEPPDNTNCFRTIEQCIPDTDECYRELARCKHVPIGMTEEGPITREVCDEILMQSGDPSLAYPWAKFAGLSINYFIVYVTSALPAGAGREYIAGSDRDFAMAAVFGKQPIPAGYTLFRTRAMTDAELSALEACAERVENEQLARFTDAERRDYLAGPGRASELFNAGQPLDDDPQFQRFMALTREVGRALFDADCLSGGVVYERVDPAMTSIEVTLGTRDLWPLR